MGRGASVSLRAALATVALAAAWLLAIPGGAAAELPHSTARAGSFARAAEISLGDPEVGPALGSGHVYWITERHLKGDGNLQTVYVHQRRLSDGVERVIFRSHRSLATALYADGGYVAFGLTKIRRTGNFKRRALASDLVYGMSAEAAAPTAVARGDWSLTFSRRVKHRNGRTYREITVSGCGDENELFDVSVEGQVLVEESDTSCSSFRISYFAQIHSLTGAAALKVGSVEDSTFAAVQQGALLTTPGEFLRVKDLATGSLLRLASGVVVDQAAIAPSGHIVSLALDVERGTADGFKIVEWLRVYAPGSTTPLYKHEVEWRDSPAFVLCDDGFVAFSEPDRGHMRMKRRTFSGQLLSTTLGPRSGLGYDATCSGGRLTLAVVRGSGAPVVLNYAL